MERWCELYATEDGLLVVEDHSALGVRVKLCKPMPFWRVTLPVIFIPCKVRVV